MEKEMHFRLESSCFQVNKSSFVPVLLFLLLVAGIADVPGFFSSKRNKRHRYDSYPLS